MYKKIKNVCKKSLKNQFDFSAMELDQIENFIYNNMGKTAKEILETLLRDDNLSDKQKVMTSYTLGASVGFESAMKDKIESRDISPMVDIQIGQGG